MGRTVGMGEGNGIGGCKEWYIGWGGVGVGGTVKRGRRNGRDG